MYVSVDGDDIGKKLTNIIYTCDDKAVTEFSGAVEAFFDNVKKEIEQQNGRVVFCAGDSIAFFIDDESIEDIIPLLQSESFNVTIGCGRTLQQAHWALNIGKSLGKNRVMNFENVIEIIGDKY